MLHYRGNILRLARPNRELTVLKSRFAPRVLWRQFNIPITAIANYAGRVISSQTAAFR